MRACLLALLAVCAAARPGLVDHPIAGDSAVYLDGSDWTTTAAGVATIPATVPGDLLSDISAAGLVGDILYEINWLNSSIWDKNVWTYKKTFTATAEQLAAVAKSSSGEPRGCPHLELV